MNLFETLQNLQLDAIQLDAEIALIIGAILLLIAGLFRVSGSIIKILFAGTLFTTLVNWSGFNDVLFNGWLVQSTMSLGVGKILITSTLLLAVFKANEFQRSSFHFILLIMLLGALILIQSQHFLLTYLAIEILSYGAYLLVNFSFTQNAHEAGIKYLLFGGVSSAVMLFGISIIYGATGELTFTAGYDAIALHHLGVVLFLAGIFFKTSLVPFHIWVPNVYQSGPIQMVTFIAVVPKLAAFAFLGLFLKYQEWISEFVLAAGVITLLLGTIGALTQANLRRIISYGAIAHSGFILPLMIMDISEGVYLWYFGIYAFMTIAVFYLIDTLEKNQRMALKDIDGLGLQVPIFGGLSTLILASQIGLPPMAGFTSKWILFSSLWLSHESTGSNWFFGYLIVAVFATVLALFYYFKITFSMFLKSHEISDGTVVKIGWSTSVILLFFTIFLILFFIFPDFLTQFVGF